MKRILVVCGHPRYKDSMFNNAILEEISSKLPQIEIRKLDELYPNYDFDVKAEQSALEKADIVVFQYPMHWYGTPGILKLYIDKVMEHGWAYGSKAAALKGKPFVVSLTVGSAEAAYSATGAMQHTIEEFSLPMKHFAALCKLDLKKIFSVCGMMYVPGLMSDEQKNSLLEKAKKQGDALVEYLSRI